ncbi:MAG TPA: fumarate hydratase [bacterium]|nr:fumarate hydratase [bacterium]
MREIQTRRISDTVRELCLDSNRMLGDDILIRIRECLDQETSPTGQEVLSQILENARIAAEEQMPLCQDTGVAVVFLDVGQDVHVTGGDLYEAVQAGVARGYQDGYFRKSMVRDPLRRENTGDNTPAFIHTEIVPGDRIKITLLPKGGGSENMSEARILSPSEGPEGIKAFVLGRVRRSGANPCPPIIVGVGIGGTLELCALIAKRSLLRRIGQRHPDPCYAALETELLESVNRLGIGPQGFGGRCTALEVFVEVRPCHIASLPVAVNIQCHAARRGEAVI